MRACRDSVVRSASIGIDVQRQQWFAFAFSGALAGLAGGLFVFSKGSVFPDEMSIPRSFDALIMVLLGGVKTLLGPLAGAVDVHVAPGRDLAPGVLAARSSGRSSSRSSWPFPKGIAGFLRTHLGPWFGIREMET